jgi:hypothetical protein
MGFIPTGLRTEKDCAGESQQMTTHRLVNERAPHSLTGGELHVLAALRANVITFRRLKQRYDIRKEFYIDCHPSNFDVGAIIKICNIRGSDSGKCHGHCHGPGSDAVRLRRRVPSLLKVVG